MRHQGFFDQAFAQGPRSGEEAGSRREQQINTGEESARRGTRQIIYPIKKATARSTTKLFLLSWYQGMHLEFRLGKTTSSPQWTALVLFLAQVALYTGRPVSRRVKARGPPHGQRGRCRTCTVELLIVVYSSTVLVAVSYTHLTLPTKA